MDCRAGPMCPAAGRHVPFSAGRYVPPCRAGACPRRVTWYAFPDSVLVRRGAFAPVRGWMGPGTALVDGPRRPPRRGGGADHGLWPGIAPSADGALGRWGISPAAAGDQRLCLWTPRFGQRAAGWQEASARNFVSEQGAALQPYWMYGKKLGRSYGAKGPATPADIPVASCPTEKNRVKLLIFTKIGSRGPWTAAAPLRSWVRP